MARTHSLAADHGVMPPLRSATSGRSPHWRKCKNPNAPAVRREEEEDWGKEKWR
jgi:hypothetical protein